MLKLPAMPPIPTPRMTTAISENPGLFLSVRQAKRRSCSDIEPSAAVDSLFVIRFSLELRRLRPKVVGLLPWSGRW